MSRAGRRGLVSVFRDLGTFVKRNKNQLRDNMTTGLARFSAHRSPAHVIRPLWIRFNVAWCNKPNFMLFAEK